jgi:hypothetical protein
MFLAQISLFRRLKEKHPGEDAMKRYVMIVLILGAFTGGRAYCLPRHVSPEEKAMALSGPGSYILAVNSIQAGGLIYFGAFHTVDAEHPQFSRLERQWRQFAPDIALSEGCLWPVEVSRSESIRKYGEQGLLRHLAYRDKVPIKCIDPSRRKQAFYLASRYETWQIKLYFVLQQAVINRRMGWKNSSDNVNTNLSAFNFLPNFAVRPFDYSDFLYMFGILFPDIKDWRLFPAYYFHNEKKGSFLTAIHRDLMEYRNKHMLKLLIKELKKGKRVFAVVGRSHVIVQEPALRHSFPEAFFRAEKR